MVAVDVISSCLNAFFFLSYKRLPRSGKMVYYLEKAEGMSTSVYVYKRSIVWSDTLNRESS